MNGVICTYDQVVIPLDLLRVGIGNDDLAQIDHKIDNKVSADEEKAFLSQFEQDVKKPTKEYQAELESGYEQTAQMGGRVVLSFLSKANDVRIQFPLSRT